MFFFVDNENLKKRGIIDECLPLNFPVLFSAIIEISGGLALKAKSVKQD